MDARLTAVIAEHFPSCLPDYHFAQNTGPRLGTQYRLTHDMLDERRKMLDIPGSTKRMAKESDFHWHDIRHDFASKLAQRGVSLQVVGTLLSHKSIVMAQRYSHLAPKQLHDAVAILDGIGTSVSTESDRIESENLQAV